jgi:hypothetical protein
MGVGVSEGMGVGGAGVTARVDCGLGVAVRKGVIAGEVVGMAGVGVPSAVGCVQAVSPSNVIRIIFFQRMSPLYQPDNGIVKFSPTGGVIFGQNGPLDK